jgi:hypothetical protein
MKLFTREISFETCEGEEGRLVISGTMRDHRLGKLLRHIEVRAEVGLVDGRIHSLEGAMPCITHEECPEALKTLSQLVGECIVPGFTGLVRRVVGSPQGCTHLSVLMTNLGNASVQGRAALAMAMFGEGADTRKILRDQATALGLPGSCYTWREDGPIMRRWGEEDKGG